MMTGRKSTATREERWSDANFEGMVKLWKLNDHDQSKLLQLRDRLVDIDHWKNDPYEVVRFYKECKGNLHKTERMFRRMVEWRIQENIDTFLERYQHNDLFHQMPISILNTTDRDGDPIYVDRMGLTDYPGLVQHSNYADELSDYNIFMRELYYEEDFWNPIRDQLDGPRVRNFNVLLDAKGLSSAFLRPANVGQVQKLARVSQDFYPGFAKRIILLRTPKIFKFIWSMTKHFLDLSIQESVILTTESDYQRVLQKYIDLENLPSCLVGEQGKAQGMPGYFEHVSLEGGPVIAPKQRRPTLLKRASSLTSITTTTSSLSSSSSEEEEEASVITTTTTPSTTKVSTSILLRGTWKKGAGKVSVKV